MSIKPRVSNRILRQRADTLVDQPVTLYHGEVVTIFRIPLSKAGHLILVRRATGEVQQVSVTAIVNLRPEGFTAEARARMEANGQTGWER
jgi:hypothetical protein